MRLHWPICFDKVLIDWSAGQYEMEGGSPRWDAKCTFDFYSSPTSKSGRFFSPRYPQLYPPSSVCLYVFFGLRGERVQVTFHNIQLDVPQYARLACSFTRQTQPHVQD